MAERRLLTVSQLTNYIKGLLTGDPVLQEVWVRGEVSNISRPASGHMYFTLKDDGAGLRCVMFRAANRGLRFKPENGLQVTAAGYVSVYNRDGQYQLYVEHLAPDGVGALHAAFEQLKARLAAEGLFDTARKRPLPTLPRRVGIVTSATGAALQDIIRVARRRFPRVDLVLYPSAVQGEAAPAQIIQGIELLGRQGDVDVIIVGRGGGSIEDLWAFNDEGVARAIYAAPVPVIAAVGHETDFTIADFAADVRAPTPSGAALLAVPDEKELRQTVDNLERRLGQGLQTRWLQGRRLFERVLASGPLQRPTHALAESRQLVDDLQRQAERAVNLLLERQQVRLHSAADKLAALSPLHVLGRGYSLTRRAADGTVIRQYDQVAVGDKVIVTLHHGTLACQVQAREEE